MKELSQLFEQYTGCSPKRSIPISGSGSNRKYYRLEGNNISLIGVKGTSLEENNAFIALSKHFKKQELNVPEVVSVSKDKMFYLQNDLGDKSLFDLIEKGRTTGKFSEEEKSLLKQTIEQLPDFQFKGAEGLDFSVCFPQETFDKRTIFWDLNYFKYYFLKIRNIEFQENLLESDFENFAKVLLQYPADTFMYRDFQSRNVMLHEGKPYFIDFQGGRKGPIHYDAASFLWQAKANFSEELREELLDIYLQKLYSYLPNTSKKTFKKELRYFILFRTLQVLGAYGFRGYIEKKKHFIESVSFALDNLSVLLKEDFPEFPYLQKTLLKLLDPPPLFLRSKEESGQPKTKDLLVTIYSFSYKKGIPEDESDNGGGYVFDCRGIHNPGKYEEYKHLTGLDRPVADFLENDGEITRFLGHIYHLADAHIQRYIERGFSHLMFCFGCTGGQHRSVYSAQRFGEYISQKYDVKVRIIHREQGIRSDGFKTIRV